MDQIVHVEQGIRLIPESLIGKTAYSGTLLENFKKCASVGGSGLIFFDKRREPKQWLQDGTFYVRSLGEATEYAVKTAAFLRTRKDVDCTPLVMAGTIPWDRYFETDQGKVPIGILFPVERVWIPQGEYSWTDVVDIKTGRFKMRPVFKEIDPKSLLS